MTLFGIFVGGKATRMGGLAKGLLPAPGGQEPLVTRLARLATELGCEPVLVGSDARYQAALPSLRTLADVPPEVGPLGGLGGLLRAARGGSALAIACDMPLVSRALLERLLREAPAADVLAPRSASGPWEPLCARYHADRVGAQLAQALAEGVRSFQQLFARLDVAELELEPAARGELVDWDSPEDIARTR